MHLHEKIGALEIIVLASSRSTGHEQRFTDDTPGSPDDVGTDVNRIDVDRLRIRRLAAANIDAHGPGRQDVQAEELRGLTRTSGAQLVALAIWRVSAAPWRTVAERTT